MYDKVADHWRKKALAASERAERADKPGPSCTTRQIIARALHLKAARLHARAEHFSRAHRGKLHAHTKAHREANEHHKKMSMEYPVIKRRPPPDA